MQQNREVRVQRTGDGYCAVAPGIYLWDEDRAEVERAARELRSGVATPRPTRRMLVIPPQEVAPPQR
jgi:hypothetical protein